MKKKQPSGNEKKAPFTAENRRAGFDVSVDATYEAGLVLTGDEVKSLRAGRATLQGGFIRFLGGGKKSDELPKLVVVGLHLAEADQPDRTRALLLNAKEIQEIVIQIQAKGKTAVPLKVYFKRGWAKLLIGVGSGRKKYDKRELLRQRDLDRQQATKLRGK